MSLNSRLKEDTSFWAIAIEPWHGVDFEFVIVGRSDILLVYELVDLNICVPFEMLKSHA